MQTRIKKWGNSLAVRIPRSLADQIDFRPDLPVSLAVNGMELTITPIREEPETLEQMLDRITDDNRHEEVDFGPPVEEEVW